MDISLDPQERNLINSLQVRGQDPGKEGCIFKKDFR